MGLVKRFEDLHAWQAARELSRGSYDASGTHSVIPDAALTGQLRRAAVSVMSNIAEGFDSGSPAEFRRFLRYAARSASEVESRLYVARDQGYVGADQFAALYEKTSEVRKLGFGLMRYLTKREARPARS